MPVQNGHRIKYHLNKVKNRFIDILKSSYEREYVPLDSRAEGEWSNEGGHPEENIREPKQRIRKSRRQALKLRPERRKKDGLKSVKIKDR